MWGPVRRSAVPSVLLLACLAAAPAGAQLAPDAGEAPSAAPGADSEPGAPALTLEEAAVLLGLEGGEPAPGPELDPTEESAARSAQAPEGAEEAPASLPLAAPPLPAAAADSLTTRVLVAVDRAGRDGVQLLRRAATDLWAGRLGPEARAVLALLAVALPLGLIAASLRRKRGRVHVRIEYPHQLRGTFCVRLQRRPRAQSELPRLADPRSAARARDAAGGSRRGLHFDVSRETLLLDVPCRSGFVSVDGFVQHAEAAEVVTAHFAEQAIEPRPGETLRLCFDFQPRACPLELRVVWGDEAVEEARVARLGAADSARFARGPVQLSLDRGHHTLLAGANDRVAELHLEIDSFEPCSREIDLGDRSQLLFSGCPRAVEPYLAGDIEGAASALEQDGQSREAHQLRARFHASENRLADAAHHYAQAGEWGAAAEIHQTLGEHARAAALYEQADDPERAGEMLRAAGELKRAGLAFMEASAWEAAADCFRESGDVANWLEALSKQGRHLAAAKLALEHNDRSQAIQCLRRVAADSPEYTEAAVMLAESYQREGHTDLARNTLEDLLATHSEQQVPCEALDRLAQLQEMAGEVSRAIALLEALRLRDPTWPHLATRVEALRKRRGDQTTRPDESTPTLVSQAFREDSRYEIVGELGRGGMGIVYHARDQRLGREVALKYLPDHIRNHPKAVELFLREARAAASLNHPNVVTVYDAGQEGDTYFITMELLRGQPLHRLLREKGRLAPGFAVKLVGQAARGLQYAHEQGIVHRDIKTANLFFTEKRVVKIMDFGLAKMVEEVRRSTTVVGGTPYYMAPEQGAGEQADHRADLYSLGITLYELLAGSVPFREGDVAFHHRHTPPPDLREAVPEIPEALAALVASLLVKQPAERLRSARDVVLRLAEVARDL